MTDYFTKFISLQVDIGILHRCLVISYRRGQKFTSKLCSMCLSGAKNKEKGGPKSERESYAEPFEMGSATRL